MGDIRSNMAALPRINRRKLFRSSIIGAAALLTGIRSMRAARGWCRSDPLITIDGYLADIFSTAPLTALLKVSGPTEIVVSVPVGVPTAMLFAGPGFGRGEKIRFEQLDKLQQTASSIPVTVAVLVPAKEDFPIGVEFAPHILGILKPARASGVANQWLILETEISTDSNLALQLPSALRQGRASRRRPPRRARRKRA
jgi:hypothetical protein